MILGISTYTYGWAIGSPHQAMNETDLLQTALDFGVRCIQIGDNLAIHNFSHERIQRLKKEAHDHTIRIEVGARALTEENLRQYIALCSDLHAPILRFVIDGDGYEPDLPEVERIIAHSLRELEESNLTLAIENHDRFKAKELAALIDSVNSEFVGICLDCVNSMGAGEGLEHVAGLLAPHTVNLHIKDFNIRRLPHKMGFTICGAQAGTGMTNIPYLVELLSRHNRCQSAVLEQWVPPEENLDATLEKEKAWAKESMEYLLNLPFFKNKM